MEDEQATEAYHSAVRVLEERFEEIFTAYTARLEENGNLLILGDQAQEDALKEQARALLGRAAASLRGEGLSALAVEEEIYNNMQAARGPLIQHPDESFRAGQELCRQALAAIEREVDLSGLRAAQVLGLSDRIQSSILDHISRVAMIAYVDYLLLKVNEVQLEERRRLSRELHDRLAHSVALVSQNLELFNALRESQPQRAEENLSRAGTGAREAIDTARELSQEMRHSDFGEGLKLALDNLMRASIPPGISYDTGFAGDESLLPAAVRDQLYLALREGIRNAIAHSGTDQLLVEVRISKEEVSASIVDHGRGFFASEEAEGVGLYSMRERISLLSGELDVSSTPGSGTKVTIKVPLIKLRARDQP